MKFYFYCICGTGLNNCLGKNQVFRLRKNKLAFFIFLTATWLIVFCIIDLVLSAYGKSSYMTKYLGVEYFTGISLIWNKKQTSSIFKRLDTVPELTVKLPFLPNYKCPCWYEAAPESGKKLRCLPYFYVIGIPKCGTTDLCNRIMMHPLISNKVAKGNHWFTKFRYGRFAALSNYLQLFDYALETDIKGIRTQDGYHNAIFGDCTPSLSWNNRHMFVEANRRNLTEKPLSNAHIIHQLNPESKIIVILRNPVERLYSEYLFFNGDDKNLDEFHRRVVFSINNITMCLQHYSLRRCVYFDEKRTTSHRKADKVRLQVGIYHVYLEDFMEVFQRQQILVIKLEKYAKQLKTTMRKIFSFLDVGNVTDPDLVQNITTDDPANTRSRDDKLIGDMLPETRKLLKDFYKPYNDRLKTLLGKEFDYNENSFK